ncbi:MAG: hypothetical protein GY804_09030 [Alphaproteobacteria bacterium]|nr:hypothetical protein [Alphaproteobacteria bacterium]
MADPILVTDYIYTQKTRTIDVHAKAQDAHQNTENLQLILNGNETYLNVNDPKITLFESDIKKQEVQMGLNKDNTTIVTDKLKDMNARIIESTKSIEYEFTMPGVVGFLYPVWFELGDYSQSDNQVYGLTEIKLFRAAAWDCDTKFGGIVTNSPAVYANMNVDTVDNAGFVPKQLKVRSYAPRNKYCFGLPSPKMWSSLDPTCLDCGYIHPAYSGFYLTGGIKYKIKTNNQHFIDSLSERIEDTEDKQIYTIGYPDLPNYYAPRIPQVDIGHYGFPENAYFHPDEWIKAPPLAGGIGLYTGGIGVANRVERSVISSGQSSEDAGNLEIGTTNHAMCSNGTNNIGIVTGGNTPGLVPIIQKLIIPLQQGSAQLGEMGAEIIDHFSVSNRLSDQGITGGDKEGADLTLMRNIQRLTVSTGVFVDISNQLVAASSKTSAASNAETDNCLVAGTTAQHEYTQKVVISTGIYIEQGNDLKVPVTDAAATSNNTDDIMVTVGGDGGESSMQKAVISTGTTMNQHATLAVAQNNHCAVSNGLSQVGLVVGGVKGTQKNIQRFLIDTSTGSTSTGVLINQSTAFAAASNA